MSGGLQWLQASGSSIIREDGATVILRGTNLPPLDRTLVTESRYALYLDTARSMGFNVARLPIFWAQLEPSNGRYSTTYIDMILKITDLAEQRSMYIVLDMHQDRLDGFPLWILARFKDTDQAARGFWNDPVLQAKLIEAWKILALRLKDEKSVFGYDLFNEPYGGSIPWHEFAPILNEFYTRLISGIRSTDPRHAILFEPVEGTCILGEHIALKPEGDNVVFSPHMYVRGQVGYLESIFLRLRELTTDIWNVPFWIGEFGGTTVDISDRDSLNSLASMLDLFDRYDLGWAYWTLADVGSGPHLVDAHEFTSPQLTDLVARVFPVSYTTTETVFSYNSTPRFELRGHANHGGEIRVSIPRGLDGLTIRCINCISVWDDDRLSLTIDATADTNLYFYMDVQGTLERLRTLAESQFSQASQISDELEHLVLHSETSRGYVQEAHDLVALMSVNLAAGHYELVLNKLDRIIDLGTSALQEEKNYRDTEEFINSVERDILGSQGQLGTWQSILLSRAHVSLSEGNCSSAREWAKQARDQPREMPREIVDPALSTVLWQMSLALMIIAVSCIILQSLRTRKAQVGDHRMLNLSSTSQQLGQRA
jgi:endoglycosylceramidase